MLTLIIGNGAALNVGAATIASFDRGGNLAAPLLAQFVGGGAESALGNFFLAFVAAVAFATIVAVVAGLVLASASAMSHDIWVGVVKGEHATQDEEVRAARISALAVGALAIVIGILAKGQNVAHLVGLAFAVAASSNLPCVLLTLYWKRCNTGGIVLGMTVGTIAAVALVLVSPNMTYPKLETCGRAEDHRCRARRSLRANAERDRLSQASDEAARPQAESALQGRSSGSEDRAGRARRPCRPATPASSAWRRR